MFRSRRISYAMFITLGNYRCVLDICWLGTRTKCFPCSWSVVGFIYLFSFFFHRLRKSLVDCRRWLILGWSIARESMVDDPRAAVDYWSSIEGQLIFILLIYYFTYFSSTTVGSRTWIIDSKIIRQRLYHLILGAEGLQRYNKTLQSELSC